MGRLFPLLFLADLALMVVALIDCLSSDESEIRALPKGFWVLLILVFSPIGPIVWFVAGRPQKVAPRVGGAWNPSGGFPEATRPRRQVAPDDDPDFLNSLKKSRREDEDMLKRWEEDLRKREDDLRKRETREDPPETKA
jgi:hypothetical protein